MPQMIIYLNRELHEKIKELAERTGKGRHDLIIELIEKGTENA